MNNIVKSIFYGTVAGVILLGLYFAILTLISGWNFAQSQFYSFWYFIISLSAGFGMQVGLYAYLKNLIKNGGRGGGVVGVTGTTSTAAMISCCAHYLTNLIPILGTVGIITFIAQYQIQLFWIGLMFNLGGILYIANQVRKAKHL